MKVIALSVGKPQDVPWHGRQIQTSIFKTAVSHRVHVGRLNLDGDEQSDLSVHGGPDKAVYAYPAEHYAWWRGQLPGKELAWGIFGENLTTEGLLEAEVCIGDRFRVGTAQIVVTQPRIPCFKLGIRFGRADMVKRFLQSGRSGFYFGVEAEGEAGPGDGIEQLSRHERRLTVADVVSLYSTHAPNQPLLERASDHPALPASWRDYFRKRLREPDA
jgi:MOSC domain-containing protein YiiM